MSEIELFKYSFKNKIFSEYLEDLIKTNSIYLFIRKITFVILFPLLQIFKKSSQKILMFYKWLSTDGDEKLVDFPLNKSSIVFEVGGYLGNYSQRIIDKFNSKIYIFEPSKIYFNYLKLKFKSNPKVKIYNFGLGSKNKTEDLSIKGSGSSVYKNTPLKEKIKIHDIFEFINKSDLERIDLIMINIEGGEYDLLPKMIKTKIISKFKYVQIQFHDFVTDAPLKRKNIIKNILKTHKILYSYPFLMEAFVIK